MTEATPHDDTRAVDAVAVAVEVRPDPCCMHGLSWALVFTNISVLHLCAAIIAMDFADRTRVDVIREFESTRRERIVVIPKTGRVQLRLPLDVPHDERSTRALALAQWVCATCNRLPR